MNTLQTIFDKAETLKEELKQFIEDQKYLMEAKANQVESILKEIEGHKTDSAKASGLVTTLEGN